MATYLYTLRAGTSLLVGVDKLHQNAVLAGIQPRLHLYSRSNGEPSWRCWGAWPEIQKFGDPASLLAVDQDVDVMFETYGSGPGDAIVELSIEAAPLHAEDRLTRMTDFRLTDPGGAIFGTGRFLLRDFRATGAPRPQNVAPRALPLE